MTGLAVLLKYNFLVAFNWRRLARGKSVFQIAFIAVFGLGLLLGMGALFFRGFRFLSELGGIGIMIVHRLFAVFFFGLGGLLVLSSVIASYSSMFRSDEVPFLMLRPISRRDIVTHKFLEAAMFASWAYFFMIIPFIGAFALHERLSLTITVWTFLFSVPFVLLCSGLGSLITLVAIRWMPRWRVIVAFLAILGVAAGWGWVGQASTLRREMDDTSFILSQLVPGLKLVSYPLWPSWWVAEGIVTLSRGDWSRGLLYGGVLLSNVGLVILLVRSIGGGVFYEGWQRVVGAAARRERHASLYRPASQRFAFLASDLRAIVIKDFLLMFRDPIQWTQGFLFFGLLAVYFFNLRNLQYHMLWVVWQNVIVFLNVFSLSAVMCSFCSRFVYPQLSLEGQGFWILGFSPTGMGRILLAKFAGALTTMLFISVCLMMVSLQMLDVRPLIRVSAFLVSVATSVAMCGLSTGLGAVFLDLRQRNPAAIISGFGGTLNLVLSLVYMVLAILPFGLLFHLYLVGHLSDAWLYRWLGLAAVWLLILTAMATVVPLSLGRRSLMARDY
ncbi:MAG: ABC-2 transporter permease [Lentisphaerae bacterium]|nr:ABC-2 transporter permease [Lentisphaerota bacterium]